MNFSQKQCQPKDLQAQSTKQCLKRNLKFKINPSNQSLNRSHLEQKVRSTKEMRARFPKHRNSLAIPANLW